MRIWRSVVGKLWMTILLLVSFVLFFLTILLLGFFENYHVNEVEKDLLSTAEKISSVMGSHDDAELGMEISWEILNAQEKLFIADSSGDVIFSPNVKKEEWIDPSFFFKDEDISNALKRNHVVKKEMNIENRSSSNRYKNIIVVAVPLKSGTYGGGAVYIYQSLDVIKDTTHQTTKLILVAAGIAIFLTTIFAFFLSTRITAPLRKMREAAFEVARGKYDTKVPILTYDEIGELATAFNQMGRQVKFHIHALNQEKEQLSSILSSMVDGVITFNRDGTVLNTNPPADRFLHQWYFEEEKKDLAIPDSVFKLLEKVVETEKEQTGELILQGRYYVIILSPLYSQENVRGAVAVVRDMTEERQLDKMRKDFIANVSHELRTPIAMLQGYSEAIIDDIAETKEEKQELAKIIHDESKRMGRLVNDLLDLAKMEAGHIVLNKESIEMDEFIERVTNKFHGPAREKTVDINAFTTGHIHAVMDPDRIEQVLTNLIDNALRHTPEGGTVDVRVRQEEQTISIQVIDSGVGIPPEDVPFVFERFYKADKARTRGKSGTGLGLAIAKNIVEAHGGEISVQSKEQFGTTFEFRLPI
jgi:two-component system sensor histidine kinase ResE